MIAMSDEGVAVAVTLVSWEGPDTETTVAAASPTFLLQLRPTGLG